MSKYKNQHFIQKAYLEGFAAKNLPSRWRHTPALWVLSKDTGSISLQSVEKTASRSYYYSFIDNNGNMNPLIERWFHPVEEAFPAFRQHVREHIEEINLTGKASNLDPKYKRLLSEYVYIHLVRVPKVFDKIREETVAFRQHLDAEKGVSISSNEAQVLALRVMIRIGQTPDKNRIAELLMKRNLHVEFFPRSRVALATSDSPVMMYDETRAPGLAHESTHVFFPLDSAIILRFAEPGDQIAMVKHRQIDKSNEFNHLIGLMADKEVYCSDPGTLLTIAKKIGIEAAIASAVEDSEQ